MIELVGWVDGDTLELLRILTKVGDIEGDAVWEWTVLVIIEFVGWSDGDAVGFAVFKLGDIEGNVVEFSPHNEYLLHLFS